MNTPDYRFKNNNGLSFPDWCNIPLGEALAIHNEKQIPNDEAPLMAFIAHKGVAEKGKKYDRSHLVKSKNKKYKRTDYNDFIYSSNNLDVGSIGLNKYGSACISDVYEIFTFKEGFNPDCMSALIQCKPVMSKILQYRQGCLYGQYKIYPESFLEIEVNVPCIDEQNKIARFFKDFEINISNQNHKIELLEKRRAGLLTKIFNNSIYFKQKDNKKYSDWKNVYLSDLLFESKKKSEGNEEVYSVSVSKGLVNQIEHLGRSFAADDTSKYKVVSPGNVVYTKSPTGDFKWGIIKQSKINKNVIVSPLYGVFKPISYDIGALIDAYFSSNIRAHNYLITQVRKGAKNTINVSNDEFLDKDILIPSSDEEIRKIVDLVSLLDSQIDIEREILDKLILQKQGFMQKMFI